jgi:hypothetical protein
MRLVLKARRGGLNRRPPLLKLELVPEFIGGAKEQAKVADSPVQVLLHQPAEGFPTG